MAKSNGFTRRLGKLGGKNFWLGVLGGVVIFALLAGSTIFKSIGVGKDSVTVEFAQAAGIKTGDKVTVAGIEKGQVKALDIEGDHVKATLKVDKELKFGPDAKAAIKMSTILGAQYVDLTPGDGSGLPGDRIPVSNTTVPFSLAKVVQDPQYPNQFDRIDNIDTAQLATMLRTVNTQLAGTPQMIPQAIDSVGALAKVIDQRKDQVQTLLKNLDSVTKVLSDNRNSVLLVITQGGAITQAIMQRQDLIRKLMDNIASLSRQLQEIGAQNGNQFGPLIGTLDTMTQGLEKNRDNLNRLFQILPVTLRQLSNATGNGPYADVNAGWLFPDNWLCFAHVIEGCAG